jgi:polyisoprenoid-binding protein YceI
MTTNPAHVAVRAGTWVADSTATTAAFHGKGVGGQKVRGTIPVNAARIEVGGSGRPLTVDAVLDATGLESGNARRDKDLRSKRFLDVERHPVIRFTAGDVTEAAGSWTVRGTLAAAGASCPVTLDVRVVEGSPEAGECRVVATATIDRADLGIKVPSFLVRRAVRLEIDALLRRA